jgi:hypothetical protein
MAIWYRVTDLDTARSFYCGRLGFTEAFVDEDDRWARLVRGEVEVAVSEGMFDDGGEEAILTLDVASQAPSACSTSSIPTATGSSSPRTSSGAR